MSSWQQAQQQRGFGASSNRVDDNKNKSWQDALQAASMAALAKGADTQTMLGFALGKFLSNYLNRGQEKRDAQNAYNIANGLNNGGYDGLSYTPDEKMTMTQGLMGDSNSMNSLVNQDDYYRGKKGIFAG